MRVEVLIIRTFEWASVLLSVTGETASVLGVLDAIRSYRAIERSRRRPDHTWLTAINVLAVLVGVIGHFGFGLLVVFGLFSAPRLDRFKIAVFALSIYVVIQTAMVSASVAVPLLTRMFRRKYFT